MLVLTVINPEYVSMLWTDPSGIRLMWYGAGMILFGVLWLRKVIRIRI
jgi:tight adherence protein B